MGMFFEWCGACPRCWEKHCDCTEEEIRAWRQESDEEIRRQEAQKPDVIERIRKFSPRLGTVKGWSTWAIVYAPDSGFGQWLPDEMKKASLQELLSFEKRLKELHKINY